MACKNQAKLATCGDCRIVLLDRSWGLMEELYEAGYRIVPCDFHAQVEVLLKAMERLMLVGSAHTGFLMSEFSDMHEYIEEIMGRPVFTHEMRTRPIMYEIQEKSKSDFVAAVEDVRAAIVDARLQVVVEGDGEKFCVDELPGCRLAYLHSHCGD